MKQLFIVSDNNKKSNYIKLKLEKKIKKKTINKSEIIVVIGGDGFMLQTLKKYYKFKKPFYGINSGDYGFLMNRFNERNVLKNIDKTDLIKISPLEMTVKNKAGKFKKSIAIKIAIEIAIAVGVRVGSSITECSQPEHCSCLKSLSMI